MTQAQLNRAVATATGESVRHIARMGFSLIVIPPPSRPSPTGSAPHRFSRPSRRHARVDSSRHIDLSA